MSKVPFQMVGQARAPDRTDHVWFVVGSRFKCCLCGAVCFEPPKYPTPPNWVPPAFDLPLSEDERRLCPREEGVKS